VCDGRLLAPGAHPSLELVEAARQFFRGRDVVIEPRELWVSGLAGRKGKIAAVAPGRALAFAEDPAWGDVLRMLWQRGARRRRRCCTGQLRCWRAGRRAGNGRSPWWPRRPGGSQRRLHRRPSRFTRFCDGTSAKLSARAILAASHSIMSGPWARAEKSSSPLAASRRVDRSA
jgi:hypothetical protein